MVTVAFGADDRESADLAGRAISEVRAIYSNVFNIPPDAIAKVNGKQVGEDYEICDDDKVTFDRVAVKHAA